jgi:hypothetical protein
MLTCYGHSCRLPRGDLTYVAFRVAAIATLDDAQTIAELEQFEAPEEQAAGFMTAVPLLASIDPIVQIDLLADVWTRQRPRECIEATLFDAAVVYAVCQTTERLFRGDLSLVKLFLREGPRSVRAKLDTDTAERFEPLFDQFWDDLDFLTLSDWQDLPSQDAEALKRWLRMADDTPLFRALERGVVSDQFRQNLRGLLTEDETDEALDVGRRLGSVKSTSL